MEKVSDMAICAKANVTARKRANPSVSDLFMGTAKLRVTLMSKWWLM